MAGSCEVIRRAGDAHGPQWRLEECCRALRRWRAMVDAGAPVERLRLFDQCLFAAAEAGLSGLAENERALVRDVIKRKRRPVTLQQAITFTANRYKVSRKELSSLVSGVMGKTEESLFGEGKIIEN